MKKDWLPDYNNIPIFNDFTLDGAKVVKTLGYLAINIVLAFISNRTLLFNMEDRVRNAFTLLSDHHKLNRDKALVELQQVFESLHDSEQAGIIANLEESITHSLWDSEDTAWEIKFAGFEAAKLLLCHGSYSNNFSEYVLSRAVHHIRHEEFRVRIAAGETLGALCKYDKPDIYGKCEQELIASIRENLSREELRPDVGSGDSDIADKVDALKDAVSIFHDTAGWRCLETSMKGLQAVIEGCGSEFMKFLNQDLLDLIFNTLEHTNRFVRETGYYLCSALVRFGITSADQLYHEAAVSKVTGIKNLGRQLSIHLRKGLSDNWSQVRMAASVATRHFFLDLESADKELYFKVLLPPMCLNRYYLAEGVRLYNQETWKNVVGDVGRDLVERYMADITEFYIEQTKSDNHAVREAACHCMEELSYKVHKDAVEPYVMALLNALLVCFMDQSWPVRDTACIACGNFILAFPTHCKQHLEKLFPLFFGNLCDPIPSVRQGGAVALGNVFRTYGVEVATEIATKINESLKGVANQSVTSDRYEGLDKGPGTYSVVKRLRDNDPHLHSNQQMYSCGSLAPKMKRGGCSDCEVHRPSEPWEAADGCLYLVGELASIPEAKGTVTKCIPLVVKAVSYSHYTQHVYLLETFCKTLPLIGKGLGKPMFKSYLEITLDPVFSALKCDNQLTKAAAQDCLESISNFLGPRILRGRIESYDPVLLHVMDREMGHLIGDHL